MGRVHFIAAFLGVIIITSFLQDQNQRFFQAVIIAFLFVLATGAFVEILEYWGFIFVGFGEGYLGFGAGDNSQNFGPWENSSLDLTFNLAGSIAAIIIVAKLPKTRTLPAKFIMWLLAFNIKKDAASSNKNKIIRM